MYRESSIWGKTDIPLSAMADAYTKDQLMQLLDNGQEIELNNTADKAYRLEKTIQNFAWASWVRKGGSYCITCRKQYVNKEIECGLRHQIYGNFAGLNPGTWLDEIDRAQSFRPSGAFEKGNFCFFGEYYHNF